MIKIHESEKGPDFEIVAYGGPTRLNVVESAFRRMANKPYSAEEKAFGVDPDSPVTAHKDLKKSKRTIFRRDDEGSVHFTP